MPTAKNIADIKSALLNPATTSHFEVTIPIPLGLTPQYLSENRVILDQGKLNLLCSDAILPGSSFTTHDISGDYYGSIHRHAYRRLYDDRIDLSFYVNAEDYLPIKYFETWMKYISGEQLSTNPNVNDERYSYRMNYPTKYISKQGLTVSKFERSSLPGAKGKSGGTLTYNFVNVFPIALNSMAVSYDSSSLLKCTVAFSYVRYYVLPIGPTSSATSTTPTQQAAVNSSQLGSTTTTGGVNFNTAGAAGNTISVQDAYSGNFTLN
jgi:hypothetical protein